MSRRVPVRGWAVLLGTYVVAPLAIWMALLWAVGMVIETINGY